MFSHMCLSILTVNYSFTFIRSIRCVEIYFLSLFCCVTNFTFLSRVMTSCNYFEYLLFYSYQTKKLHFVPQRVGYNLNMCILMAYVFSDCLVLGYGKV